MMQCAGGSRPVEIRQRQRAAPELPSAISISGRGTREECKSGAREKRELLARGSGGSQRGNNPHFVLCRIKLRYGATWVHVLAIHGQGLWLSFRRAVVQPLVHVWTE